MYSTSWPLAISEIMQHLEVTRNAVHQRLLRLMYEGLVDRELVRGGRGRPSYRYLLSPKARKLAGNNFADFAAVLWQEVLGIEDPRRRQHAIRRIAGALKALYPAFPIYPRTLWHEICASLLKTRDLTRFMPM